MSRDWRDAPPPHYPVPRIDRSRTSSTALHSMSGSEFTGTGAVYAPLGMLPPVLRLAAFVLLLLVAMGGCTAAWIDQQSYTPSPNVCRSANSGVPPEKSGSCVPASQVREVRR